MSAVTTLPSVHYLGHATVTVDLGGVRVLTDPVLFSRTLFLDRIGDSIRPSDVGRPDVVVVSHLHHDHCDVRSLRVLGPDVPIIVPRGTGTFAAKFGAAEVYELAVGDTFVHGALTVTAVPAVHDGFRVPFGPHAVALGYLLEAGEASVYFAGDTDIYDGMADLRADLDVALLPVWGWGPNLGPGHLTPVAAAEALELLRPRYAVPIHWGTLYPVGLRRLWPSRSDVLWTPPRDFASAAARAGYPGQVLVTSPGHPVSFAP